MTYEDGLKILDVIDSLVDIVERLLLIQFLTVIILTILFVLVLTKK